MFWSDILVLDNIMKQDSNTYIHINEVVKLHSIYSILPLRLKGINYRFLDIDKEAIKENPFDLRKFCPLTQRKLVVYNSHASYEKVLFCHNNQGPILNK